MSHLHFLLPGVVVLGLSGCGQEPDAPPKPVDLVVAAQTWNTTDKQWGEAELHQLVEGERLYRKRCAGCHLSSGEGQLTLGAPALRNSAVAKGPAGGLMTTVLFGRGTMPAFHTSLKDADIALILSYVRNAWGNQQGDLIAAADVAAARSAGK
jgi:cytochrome c oxidase subunit 2